jgi:hypothetical protein
MFMELIVGRVFSLVTIIVLLAIIYYTMSGSERGTMSPQIRRFPAVEAIPEAVRRCAETGRPLFQTFGYGPGGLKGDQAGMWLAALSVLGYVTDECVELGVPMIVIPSAVEIVPMANDIIRDAYTKAGKADEFNMDIVRYVPAEQGNQFTYIQTCLGVLSREKPAANIFIGPFYVESIMFGEESAVQGAISVSGTANMHQLAFFLVTTDYTLIGEETYAAGAALSQDKTQIGTILGQDIGKALTILLVLIGAIAATFGLDVIHHMLEA